MKSILPPPFRPFSMSWSVTNDHLMAQSSRYMGEQIEANITHVPLQTKTQHLSYIFCLLSPSANTVSKAE